jgi:hypothetical protein
VNCIQIVFDFMRFFRSQCNLIRYLIAGSAALALVLEMPGAPVKPAYAGDPPCTTLPENLSRNGSITEGGYETPHGIVANGWTPFRIGGEWPAFLLHDAESANGDVPGSSAQFVHANDIMFDAGIYQEITGTQPGAWYEFKVGWARALRDRHNGRVNQSIDNVIMRQVGADPFGGTEPTSPNVIWGPEFWHGSQGLNAPQMRVTFKALSERVTVFVRIRNANDSPSDKIFLDVMCLLPRTDIPPETLVPTPTATLVATEPPPTRVPATRALATATPPAATPIPPTPKPAQVWTVTPQAVALEASQPTRQPRRNVPQIDARSGDETDSRWSAWIESSAFPLVLLLGFSGIVTAALVGILLVGFLFRQMVVRRR